MNIIFSTTRQWNPGDEFIHRGVVHLLEGTGLRFNAIAWNRHPSIRPGNTLLDNSFDELRHDPSSIDYVVFAGTPEWQGGKVAPLYRLIAENGLRCAFLGIGCHGGNVTLNPVEEKVFRDHADLVTCRDRATHDSLVRVLPGTPVHLIPCPSIFHAAQTRVHERLESVAVIYQTTHTRHQEVSSELRERIISLIRKLLDRVNVEVLCNYIDECAEASQLFGSGRVAYSYTSSDYEGLFRRVDCVIGARLHGCLGAMSTGTPAMLLGTGTDGRRKGAADQVPLLLQDNFDSLDQLVESVLSLDVAAHSAKILEWREQQRAVYDPLIRGLDCVVRGPQGAGAPAVLAPERVAQVLRANEDRLRRVRAEQESKWRLKRYLKKRLPPGFSAR